MEVFGFLGDGQRATATPTNTKPGVAADVILVQPGRSRQYNQMQQTGDRAKKACPLIFRGAGKFFFHCPMFARFLSWKYILKIAGLDSLFVDRVGEQNAEEVVLPRPMTRHHSLI